MSDKSVEKKAGDKRSRVSETLPRPTSRLALLLNGQRPRTGLSGIAKSVPARLLAAVAKSIEDPSIRPAPALDKIMPVWAAMPQDPAGLPSWAIQGPQANDKYW